MTKKAFMRCPIWFLMCIVAVLLLSSCQSMKPELEREYPQAGMLLSRQLFHVWHPLATQGAEVAGYGMYTYVLFGRRVDDQRRLDAEIWERYESLLDAITQSTPSEREVKVEKAESNIFYIPAIKPYGKFHFPLNNYNSSLALDYITRLGRMIKAKPHLVERFTLRPGPFLISTFNPLGEATRGELDLLYADLSDSNPAAMRETVSAYKKRVSREEVIGIQKFNSIRLALLNLILYVDDNLQIVRAEASEWLDEDQ